MKNQKKNKLIFIIILIIIPILTISTYKYIYDNGFVEKNMIKYTGIKKNNGLYNYIVTIQYHNSYQSFIETIISNENKRLLLQNLDFENTFKKKIKGRVEQEFLTENDGYIYHVNEKGYGIYGYYIVALEKNGNKMQIYEFYGD